MNDIKYIVFHKSKDNFETNVLINTLTGKYKKYIVYDYENLKVLPDEIVHDMPAGEWRRVQRAKGYHYVLVNGEVTIKDDQQTDTFSGRLLRFGTGLPQDHSQAAE